MICFCFFCAAAGNALAQATAAQTDAELSRSLAIARAGNEVLSGADSEIKRDALFRLRNFQSAEASRKAVPGLRDPSEIVRATAAFAVIYLPKDEAFVALAPNLSDKSEFVRRETAYALGKIQNPSAIAPLIQTFQRDKSIEVKNASIVALGEIGEASAVDFLLGILRQKPSEDNDFLRRAAARAIGQIAQIIQVRRSLVATPESFLPDRYKLAARENYRDLTTDSSEFRAAVPQLIELLRNSRETDDTRRETAFALGAIGNPDAISALQAAANGSKDFYLMEIVKESLKKLSSVEN